MRLYTIINVEHILSLTQGLWLVLCVVWIGTSLGAKRAAYKEGLSSRLGHIAPIALGLYLLFGRLPFQALNHRMYGLTTSVAVGGLILVAAGSVLSMSARLILGDNWSAMAEIKEVHSLTLHGPYRFVRHPIYTGFLIALCGSALQAGRVSCLVALIVCFWGLWRKVKVEERLLVHRFGEQYIRYQHNVSAILPFLW